MKEKDKQIAKDSALAIADGIVATIPLLAIAWGLSKSLYGAGLKLRQQRALEFVEMIRDNPEVFTEQLLEQEEFQDGFVYSLEKYLTERNENRRKYFRSIFLGFAKSEDKPKFELERFYHTLSQLNEYDISILGYVDVRTSSSYQVFDDREALGNVYNLINVGILYTDPSARLGNIDAPYVYTSDFGRRFIQYLKNE